ncbi:MAG TPA: hypothetical protein VIR30_14300 [Nocardioides sp.]
MPDPSAPAPGVSWPTATMVALLVPPLVFWTSVPFAVAVSERAGLTMACVLWLALGGLAFRIGSRRTRGWGLGLVAGALACLPWVVSGLVNG